MSFYLVVTHQTAGSPELLERVTAIAHDDSDARFHILVPATSPRYLVSLAPGFPMMDDSPWYPEADTQRMARDAGEEARRRFVDAGLLVVETSVGTSSPLVAIEDALRGRPETYAAIILSTFPPGISRWLHLDVHAQAERRLDVPVIHVISEPGRESPRPEESGAKQ